MTLTVPISDELYKEASASLCLDDSHFKTTLVFEFFATRKDALVLLFVVSVLVSVLLCVSLFVVVFLLLCCLFAFFCFDFFLILFPN